MNNDQNNTRGVLTDAEIHDLGLIAMQAGWPNAEFARAIEAAVLEKVGVSRIAEDRIYDLLSELASIDTYNINLRDHPAAYAIVEAAVLAKAAPQSPVAPALERTSWHVSHADAHALAQEIINGANAMGGPDDDGLTADLVLQVRPAGTVANDEGELNPTPILGISLAEYPEEGLYPIDPAAPTPPTSAADAAHVKLLKAASSALRSYQYGNSSPDLAVSIAGQIDAAIAATGASSAGGES